MTPTKRRRLTFAAARTIVFERLRAAGWLVDTGRQWPRALYRARQGGGSAALYFKPQAIWIDAVDRGEPLRSDATSSGEDPRDLANMAAADMAAYLADMCERWISRASNCTPLSTLMAAGESAGVLVMARIGGDR